MYAAATLDSPLGPLQLHWTDDGLCGLELDHDERRVSPQVLRFGAAEPRMGIDPWHTRERLAAWFAGDLDALNAIPLDAGGTPFQRRVWEALRGIPPGETRTYAELAEGLGSPKAFRAVGGACGANPIAILVPCHRAVRTDGGLGGFAFGLEVKRWLLRHERALKQPQQSLFGE